MNRSTPCAGVARRRTRAAITTAAALLAAAAFSAGPAQAAVAPSAVDPNTTLPNSFTDATGLELGLCTNAGCAGARPNQDQPVAVPGNFFADAEAFWYLNEVTLNAGLAEFAVEGAFESLEPNGGGAFTRQRFRFSNLSGTIRVTTPYGTRIYDQLGGGNRAINDTVDLGLIGGCIVPSGSFCDFAGANYGNELTHFLVPVGFVPGAPGSVTTYSGPVVGSPTGYNGVKIERQVTDPVTGLPTWELVEEQTNFTLEMQMVSPPAAPAVFAGLSSTAVGFLGRRSDEASGTKRVTVRNDGAAPMSITGVGLSGFNAGSFTATGCAAGTTLAPHTSCDVVVGFTGTSVGTHEATLTVTNSSANAPALAVALSGLVTSAGPAPQAQPQPQPQPTQPQPQPQQPGATTTIVQTVPGFGATTAAPATSGAGQGILGTTARSLRVSNLRMSSRLTRARLRAQGVRATMSLQQGTNVVRVSIYRARNGQRTGKALFIANRAPRSAGLYQVVLRDRSLIRRLSTGSYVLEARAGQSRSSLGSAARRVFRIVR